MISKKHIQTINLNLFYCWCHYVDREEEQIENDYPPPKPSYILEVIKMLQVQRELSAQLYSILQYVCIILFVISFCGLLLRPANLSPALLPRAFDDRRRFAKTINFTIPGHCCKLVYFQL